MVKAARDEDGDRFAEEPPEVMRDAFSRFSELKSYKRQLLTMRFALRSLTYAFAYELSNSSRSANEWDFHGSSVAGLRRRSLFLSLKFFLLQWPYLSIGPLNGITCKSYETDRRTHAIDYSGKGLVIRVRIRYHENESLDVFFGPIGEKLYEVPALDYSRRRTLLNAFIADIDSIARNDSATILKDPLFQEDNSYDGEKVLDIFEFDAEEETWDFWRRWYDGLLNSKPVDLNVQKDIGWIPLKEWVDGPSHIARLIAEIEARYLADAVAERIELAPSGRLALVSQDFPNDRHLGLLIDTVRDALDLATSGIRNELPEDAYQVRLLRHTFARYGNDPQRIEMDFERARVSLIEDIAADAIPASAPNRDLVQALADAAGAIRASDPEIAENRERLNRIRLGKVSPEDAARIAEAAEKVAEISEGVLRDDLMEDRFRLPGVRRSSGVPDPVVPVGTAERNAALEAQAAQLRLYSRLAKVWLFLKAHDREIALVGSLASIVGLIVAVVAL
jgi:hypothetical protein